MSIASYIRVIGRGKVGARALDRQQAADLLGQILDGRASELQVGAFCLAMRIKGETPQEMAGFLDATQQRLQRVAGDGAPSVVLPSYNGARKLPVLTPLLALLLARQGAAVLVHGCATEDPRTTSQEVFAALGVKACTHSPSLRGGDCVYVPTTLLSPALERLLQARRSIGLRNPAHSLVKLMNPCADAALIVGSYTHAEYAQSMAETFALMGAHAMLLRGTEGEPVTHPRRTPAMSIIRHGQQRTLQGVARDADELALGLPQDTDAQASAQYINAVLEGKLPIPAPIAQQLQCLLSEIQSPQGNPT